MGSREVKYEGTNKQILCQALVDARGYLGRDLFYKTIGVIAQTKGEARAEGEPLSAALEAIRWPLAIYIAVEGVPITAMAAYAWSTKRTFLHECLEEKYGKGDNPNG